MLQATFYQRRGKRWMDLALAVPLCLALLPVMFAIAALVRINLGRPVLFRQVRPGYRTKPLSMLKFRTMTEEQNADGRLLPDEQRLTVFGKWLRSTSLDELPELWHVLRGEMSLIGPRPLLTGYLDRYSLAEARRHDVLPGVTGWAQVNGRNALDWDTRLALDAWYVDHLSLQLDLQILVRTIGAVLSRAGVSQPGHATVLPLRPHLERLQSETGLFVLGAGGHAKVVIATMQAAGHRVAAVLDDDASKWGGKILGVEISGPLNSIRRLRVCRAVIAVGDNAARRRIAEQFRAQWLTIIHPHAWVHESVALGEGTIVCAGAVVQPDARIGAHAIVNTSASVDHDCLLSDFVHVAPGVRLAGGVRVGAQTLIGVGACVLPGVEIGDRAVIGAGSVVVRDLDDDVVAVGNPARVSRESNVVAKVA